MDSWEFFSAELLYRVQDAVRPECRSPLDFARSKITLCKVFKACSDLDMFETLRNTDENWN